MQMYVDGDSGAHRTSEMMPELQFLTGDISGRERFSEGEIPEGRFAAKQLQRDEVY